MTKKDWGPTVWILFHSLCELIKEEYFLEEKNNILNHIKAISYNLPCPYCSTHAMQYFKKIYNNNYNTKQNLKILLWSFHNNVNLKTKKELKSLEYIEKYKNANLNKIINQLIMVYNQSYISNKYIMYKFHSQKVITAFLNYINSVKDKFNNYD